MNVKILVMPRIMKTDIIISLAAPLTTLVFSFVLYCYIGDQVTGSTLIVRFLYLSVSGAIW